MTVSQDRVHDAVLTDDRFEQRPRWSAGERLHDLFAELVVRHPDRPAMDTGTEVHTFADIDRHAGSLAALLAESGVAVGDRVAIVLDRPFDAYSAMLAVSRIGAAFVPLDVAFPLDRIDYICGDADARVIVTSQRLHDCLPDGDRTVVDVEAAQVVDPVRQPEPRVGDALAYVIYTSGTTGRPKGVAVDHSSICNFVRVAAEVYGYHADDRVYQGMTIAFDFSVEESWVPWLAGATLVPRPAGGALIGADLQSFVLDRGITALCCVPTLLSTLDAEQLSSVRFVLVSGEACPAELVTRWHRPERRFLNVYGPTEATVTATWGDVHPDRPVTLGRPLPTYSAVVLDADTGEIMPAGEVGEIGLAGIGLARGYLGRDELTVRAFVDDVIGLPNNPSGRIYRTGDLGRVTPDGQLEYLGRIDTQVKIRGYRIELTEIESVLLGAPGVGQAVVATFEPVAGMTELVAYYTAADYTAADRELDEDELHAALARRLPSYMVPAYFHRLDAIPFTTSDKVDRRALPAPTGGRRASRGATTVAAETELERTLARLVESVLDVRDVSVTADLFLDLGGNSLLMATLCAAARSAGHPLSIRDCYRTPTIRGLAAGLAEATDETLPGAAVQPRSQPVDRRSARRRSAAFAATGVAQLALVFGYFWALTMLGNAAYDLADGVVSAVVVGVVVLLAACVAPIALKWLLIGRWREQTIPLWGPRYLRFWLVKTLVRANPLALFVGTPLYNAYLRSLGARIGPRAVIQTRHVPVCTDLVSVGADAVIRADVWMQGYHADGTMLSTGAIGIGAGSYVGESAVLDIATSLGTDAQLAHASSLHTGQHLPDGRRWHGSPASPAPATSEFRRLRTAPQRSHDARTVLAQVLGFAATLAVVLGLVLIDVLLVGPGTGGPLALLIWSAIAAVATFFGGLLIEATFALLAGRWLSRLLRPGTEYPMHGPHHAVLRMVELAANRPILVSLLGDSALITGWMRALGWDLGRVQQTGSNFGTTHRSQVPLLSHVGRGTMISDGLSMANADISSTHFRVRETVLGQRSFVGNRVVVPADARIGDNVLLATKVLVPVDGPVRHDTGLLGSPAFEIPRSSERDTVVIAEHDLAIRLAAKRRHNLVTMSLLLVCRWFGVFLVLALALTADASGGRFGSAGVAAVLTLTVLVSAAWFVAVEVLATRRHLEPRQCSIYEPYFWRHERTWKLLTPYLVAFDGTPFKPLLLRALGVRVGARLFDDGAAMPEHPLVRIGSDCALNAGTTIQAHSLEDGMFKSDHVVLGDDVTLGVGAFVHYAAELADGARLAPDSFLMKGSIVEARTTWGGNPAVPITTDPSTDPSIDPSVASSPTSTRKAST